MFRMIFPEKSETKFLFLMILFLTLILLIAMTWLNWLLIPAGSRAASVIEGIFQGTETLFLALGSLALWYGIRLVWLELK